jgi:hypothetical protein
MFNRVNRLENGDTCHVSIFDPSCELISHNYPYALKSWPELAKFNFFKFNHAVTLPFVSVV